MTVDAYIYALEQVLEHPEYTAIGIVVGEIDDVPILSVAGTLVRTASGWPIAGADLDLAARNPEERRRLVTLAGVRACDCARELLERERDSG
jgi:hypothetical protein